MIHRYWRLLSDITDSGINSFAQIDFYIRNNGKSILINGNPMSSHHENHHDAVSALDGNPSSYWCSGIVTETHTWWSYDFGPDSKIMGIIEIAITSRNDEYYFQTPVKSIIQYSDNDTDWIDWGKVVMSSPWIKGQCQILAVNALRIPVSRSSYPLPNTLGRRR